MKKAKLYLKSILFFVFSILYIFTFINNSYAAGKVTNKITWFGQEPSLAPNEKLLRSNGTCNKLGKNRCWVSDPDTTFCKSGNISKCTDGNGEWETGMQSIFSPKIAVNSEYSMNFIGISFAKTRTVVLEPNECKYVLWSNFVVPIPLRICARIAYPVRAKYPGDPGYDPDAGYPSDEGSSNDGRENDGNKTGIVNEEGTGLNYTPPRPLLCAYRDSWDLADTDFNVSPYHKRTPASEVENMNTYFTKGLFPGFPPGVNALGSILFTNLGIISSIITSKVYNYDVRYTIGCIPVPIGPMPPAFCHSCWQFPVQLPITWLSKNSTFSNIKANFQYCNIGGNTVECKFDPPLSDSLDPVDSGGSLKPLMVGYEQGLLQELTLNTGNNYNSCKKAFLNEKEVEFCAEVSAQESDKVCLYYQLTGGSKNLLRCIPRPHFMPLPEVFVPQDGNNDANDSSYLSPKVGVRIDGQEIVLQENPQMYLDPPPANFQEWDKDCKELEKVEFCVYRPCQKDENGSIVYDSTGTYCINEPRLCVEGYDGDNKVVINRENEGVLYGSPNQYINGHWEYTGSSSDLVALDTNNILSLRKLTLEELGLCVGVPHDPTIEVFNYKTLNLQQTYTVPENCGKVRFTVLGGGSAGKWTYKCTGIDCDYSGGGGGYAVGEVEVSPGDKFKLIVGKGGNSSIDMGYTWEGGGESGTQSKVLRSGNKIIYALGANKAFGGNAGGSFANIKVRRGYDGKVTTGSTKSGGKAGDKGAPLSASTCGSPDKQVKTVYGAPGSGGCASDDKSAHETWSYGGHGRITAHCVAPSMESFVYHSCPAINIRIHSEVTFPSQEDTYYSCQLPVTAHGGRVPESSCQEDNSNPTSTEKWESYPTMPVCNDGVWSF